MDKINILRMVNNLKTKVDKINILRMVNNGKIKEIRIDSFKIINNKYLVFKNGKLNLNNIDIIYVDYETKRYNFSAYVMIIISGKEYQLDLEREYYIYQSSSDEENRLNKLKFDEEVKNVKIIIDEILSLANSQEF